MDNFNRADSTNLGSPWAEQTGDVAVAGNEMVGVGSLDVAANVGVAAADQAAEVSIALASGQTAGLVARYTGPADSNMYYAGITDSNGVYTAQIWGNLDGTWNLLALTTLGKGTGRLRFEVVGASLKLFLDGDLIASAGDTAITGPGYTGVRATQGALLDDFFTGPL
jgi:hypothetical protein